MQNFVCFVRLFPLFLPNFRTLGGERFTKIRPLPLCAHVTRYARLQNSFDLVFFREYVNFPSMSKHRRTPPCVTVPCYYFRNIAKQDLIPAPERPSVFGIARSACQFSIFSFECVYFNLLWVTGQVLNSTQKPCSSGLRRLLLPQDSICFWV